MEDDQASEISEQAPRPYRGDEAGPGTALDADDRAEPERLRHEVAVFRGPAPPPGIALSPRPTRTFTDLLVVASSVAAVVLAIGRVARLQPSVADHDG